MTSIIISLILISVLVIAHEFGHFIVAKKSGICVEEFSVGMGKKLVSIQRGETEYSIRLLPVGGFCRMEGEQDDGIIGPKSFLSKSVGTRFLVMAAGPFMNFLLAFVMIFGITSQTAIGTPIIRDVVEGSAAQEAGLLSGDKIFRLNNSKIHIYDEIQQMIFQNKDKPISVEVLRDGALHRFELTPTLDSERGTYLIGFHPEIATGIFYESNDQYRQLGVLEMTNYSYHAMMNYIKVTAEGLTKVFTFTAERDEYGGPITMVQIIGSGYEAGIQSSARDAILNVIYIGAVLSANLGVLNLFPIPALDGGKILLLALEAIRRKPLNVELENKIQFLGFVFLMGLMFYVMFGDIAKLIT